MTGEDCQSYRTGGSATAVMHSCTEICLPVSQQYDNKSKCNNYNHTVCHPGEEYSFPPSAPTSTVDFSDNLWRLVSLHRLSLQLLHHIFIHGLFLNSWNHILHPGSTNNHHVSITVCAGLHYQKHCMQYLMQLLMIINMNSQVYPYSVYRVQYSRN